MIGLLPLAVCKDGEEFRDKPKTHLQDLLSRKMNEPGVHDVFYAGFGTSFSQATYGVAGKMT